MGLLDQVTALADQLDEEARKEAERQAEVRRRRREARIRALIQEAFGTDSQPEAFGKETYWVADDLVFLVRNSTTSVDGEREDVPYLLVLTPIRALERHALKGYPCRTLEEAADVLRKNRGASFHKDAVLAVLANGTAPTLPAGVPGR